jgi:hypothetical protein
MTNPEIAKKRLPSRDLTLVIRDPFPVQPEKEEGQDEYQGEKENGQSRSVAKIKFSKSNFSNVIFA